jgi:hypothetical protein
VEPLNLQGGLVVEWQQYVNLLHHNALKLMEEDGIIKWSRNPRSREYTVKLGYVAKFEKGLVVENFWW